MNYLFICEYNKKIGLGHLSRCKNLASYLIKKKNNCIFLSNNSNKNILKKFDIEKSLKFKNVNWDYKKNYKKLIDLILNEKIDFIIIDNYEISFEWCRNIHNFGFKIIQFTDFKFKKYFSDILINPNSNSKFNNKMKNSIQFSGNKYSFIEDEFIFTKKEKLKLDAKNLKILVYLGSNFSKEILSKLLFRFNNFKDSIKKISIITNNKIVFKKSFIQFVKFLTVKKLVSIIDKNNIIFTAGGTFLIKCLIREKKVFSILTHKNQKENLDNLKKNNQIFLINKSLNNITYKNIINFINKTKKNIINTKDLNFAQKSFYETNLKIYQKNIKLIPKNKNQINLIYNIQNEKDSRKFALQTKKITKREHSIWFNKLIKNKNYFHFIIKQGLNNVGILSFKLNKGKYVISIIIKKRFRGNNLAFTALNKGMNILSIHNKPYISFVKKENLGSIRLFEK